MWRTSGVLTARCTLRRKQDGFTLLETLVALLLLAVVGAALYGSYFSVERARERASDGGEERRELRWTLDLLRREIDGMFYKPGDKRLHLVVEDRDSFGRPASTLAMTTSAPPAPETGYPASDLLTVRYGVQEKERRLTLSREVRDPFGSQQPITYPQLAAVEGFLVECYDAGKWVRSWNTELTPRLPERVRITLTVPDGAQTAVFSTTGRPRVR